MEKIVVCCDGSGNSFDYEDENSTVAKLYSSLKIYEYQIGYYHPAWEPWALQTAEVG
jgi:uncharacterized protein (DUF2235 family)